MTIEQKAQRYDKTLEQLKGLIEVTREDKCDIAEEDIMDIFPELIESDDEKIRKELIEKVKETPACIGFDNKNAVLTWLEKQGEPTDINPSEFDLRLNKLLKQFETLSKEELASSLSFYLNVVQNDGTYKAEEKHGEQPRYSIGDVLCNKSCTILNKDAQPNFEITDIRNGMYICDKCSFPISQQDEYELVAKKPYGQRKECWDCQFNYAGECKGFCQMKKDEQKPADKVEPKFNVGDWVVDNAGYIWKIKGILNQFYILEDVEGGESRPTTEWADDTFHLWTIQDAEDGDVLQLGKVTAIFKEHISNVSCKCHCSVYNGEFEIPSQNDDDNCYGCHDTIPATREQRDLLFAKMKEAGYKWDAESKELKEIEQEPTEWSEEDENNLYLTTKAVAREYSGELFLDPKIVNEQVGIGKKLINWLNSFENRVQPQQEWNKQDEDYMKSAIELIMHCIWKSYRGLYKEDVVEWLKSLKYRFTENKEELN